MAAFAAVPPKDRPGLPPDSGLHQIYTSLRPDLLRFLTARMGDSAMAEDVLQELWLRLRDAKGGPVANARAYLYRAAHHIALDMIRTRRRSTVRDGQWAALSGNRGEPVDPNPGAAERIIEREEADRLAAAIAALPMAAGRAFRMHKIDGVSHAEIATRLGISRSGVEKHIAVAMAHLRRALQD